MQQCGSLWSLKSIIFYWWAQRLKSYNRRSGILTQNESELSRRKQDLQAAAEERQQIVGVRRAELSEQLLLSAAEGRLLCPVERHNVTGHLTGNKSNNNHHTSPDLPVRLSPNIQPTVRCSLSLRRVWEGETAGLQAADRRAGFSMLTTSTIQSLNSPHQR